jgi:uncharacterized protein YajQ (UPF0234 family)
MIIGIFTQVDDAEICLNNLAEADFQPQNISVVMKDPEEVEKISDTSGELNKLSVDELIDRLIKLGLPKKNAKRFKDMIEAGGVFISVSTANANEEKAVKEILKDQNGKLIKKI